MFCTFVFTASCKADHCCGTQGLFGGGKWWWHSICNPSPCKQHHVFLTSSDGLSSELTRPPVPKKTKSSSFHSSGGVLIRERAEDSHKLQERIEALRKEQGISCNSRVQFWLYLTSMIPHIHDSILVDFLDESHRLLLQYVCQSYLIKLQETQQQQHQQPYHLPHPSHQQPFVARDMQQFQQPLSTNQQAPKFQHIPFHLSFPVQPVSITKARPVASHQRLVTALPSNICTVNTSSSSTSSSTATSGGIFNPSMTLASLVELQPAMLLTPSTSFLNVNLNTHQPGGPSDKG